MNETLTGIISAVIAIGSMPAVLKLIDWAKASKSGRVRAEKERNRSVLGRVADAEYEAEYQAEWRRILREHAATVRQIALDWGVPANILPDWPKPPAKQKA